MMTLKFRLDQDPLPPGVEVTTGDNGECVVAIEPVAAFALQGSKGKLAAARRSLAEVTEDRAHQTRVLMTVTLALSGLLEAVDRILAAQETDEGREVLSAYLTVTQPAARAALAQVGDSRIDWCDVVFGRTSDAEPPQGIWSTMAAELRPMVNGPEGAALIMALEELAEIEGAEPGYGDALHGFYLLVVEAAGAARAVIAKEPQHRATLLPTYRGLIQVALSLIRLMALRQTAASPDSADVVASTEQVT